MAETRHRVAIVTGAASGLGEATSYAFGKQGLSVVLVDINGNGLVKVADNMKNQGVSSDKILTITEDLAEESSYESVINQTISKFGQIDVLVNNAGFAKVTTLENLTVDYVDREYKVMLRAPLFLSQKAFPHLKKTKGCIVMTSSTSSRMVVPGSLDYSAIKAGLEHLTRGLALEGAPSGIRVNSVHPSALRTSLLSGNPREDEIWEAAEKIVPMGRLGSGKDIASAILYLASDAASYVTGASLFVDGGSCLASPWGAVTSLSTSS